ncbi:RNA-binding protein [Ignavigranum ruoffiae]|uniref:YlmH family RNA-binding protein n=1 Tax=Ignavigranum ruoffiae TaxID=89093 RepID=UPI0024AD04F4|nr:YlmH/Sll1252 family protein [Ignavigranum ruoffiae]
MDHIYQHYRPEEYEFIDKVAGWIEQVVSSFAPYVTLFLTPRELMIVKQMVASSEDLQMSSFGAYQGAERQRAIIYPLYYQPLEADYQLTALNVNYPQKFGELSHGKILGSLINSGIERDRIGDIITDGSSWHIILDQTMADYIMNSVRKIANVGVHLEPIALSEILESNETWEEITVIASSLRLDTLLGKVYNFSRQRAKNYIAAGMVKVNFVPMERPDREIGENDIVSLRKFGRFWIDQMFEPTKKGNFRLNIRVLLR